MKNTWNHLTFEQRKAIASGIAHNCKVCEIAETIGFDPTSISKEVKRNRIKISSDSKKSVCPKTQRWPYVCSNCSKRYSTCSFEKYRYDAKFAQSNADTNLINSRKGIDITSEEFTTMDNLIKEGVLNNESIYQIKVKNNESIPKSLTTVYRYINKGYLKTKRTDLPYAVTYKKRKHNKKYDYSNNFIDRSNHKYLDYLAYLHNNPNAYVWKLDFLGAIKTDSKNILSFILPNFQVPLIKIIDKPDSSKIVDFFDELEEKIGTEAFIKLIPAILTDRDPCFADINGICVSKITGEERCKLFFCDPYVSSQKPNVENLNKRLRLFFPKGKSVDKYTQNDIKQINKTLLNRPLRSLDRNSAKDAFIKIFDEELFEKIF